MKHTFGNTRAAERLEELLKDNPSARRKVSRLLSAYTRQLFAITGAKDPITVRKCMGLLKEDTLRRVKTLQNVPADVRTYTENVVVCRFRVYRSCFDDLVPYIVKMLAAEKKGLTSEGSQV